MAIMVRYQVEAVLKAVAEGLPANDEDTSWIALLSENDAVRLLRIFEALRRIELGTFGECTGCGLTIDHGRLETEPEAPLCDVCRLFASCPTELAS